MAAASFKHTLCLTSVPKETGRFLIKWLASLIYYRLPKNKASTLEIYVIL
jgi:hypothetical protein